VCSFETVWHRKRGGNERLSRCFGVAQKPRKSPKTKPHCCQEREVTRTQGLHGKGNRHTVYKQAILEFGRHLKSHRETPTTPDPKNLDQKRTPSKTFLSKRTSRLTPGLVPRNLGRGGDCSGVVWQEQKMHNFGVDRENTQNSAHTNSSSKVAATVWQQDNHDRTAKGAVTVLVRSKTAIEREGKN